MPHNLNELPVMQPKYVGKDVPRIEDATLLMGRAEFTDNLAFPGMLHAAVLQSPHPHARIKRIDTSKAEALKGVVAVITGAEAKEWSDPVPGMPGGWAGHALAVDKVRFAGDPVAAIAATSRYIAEDARDLIEVEYEILPAITDPVKALDPGGPFVWDHHKTNVIYHRIFTFGEVDSAFTNADLVVSDSFRWHRASGNPIETCSCIVQWTPHDNALTAWGGFQGTGFYTPSVSRSLRIPANKIRLVPLPHGGSFGTKIFPHSVIRMGLLSRKAGGKPVKWIEDRLEHLRGSYTHGPDRHYSAEMALTRDGEITGFKIKVLDDMGAQAVSVAVGKTLKPLSAFTGPYRVRHAEYDLTVVATNKCPQGSYRGWGVPPHNLAMEHLIELGAQKLKLDPAEIRRRNLLRPDQFPYESPNGAKYDSGDYERTLDMALELAGYQDLRRKQAEARAEGRLVGIGVYTGVEISAVAMSMFTLLGPDSPFGTSMPESARVRIDASGKILAEVTFPWEGQGQHSFVANILADYFGVKREDVSVTTVDSLAAGPGTGPIGSRQAVVLSGATLGAAERVAEKLRKVAAVMMEADAEDVELMNGQLRIKGSPDKALALQKVVTMMLTRCDLLPEGVDGNPEASYTYNPPDRKLPDAEGRGSFDLTAANAAHVVMVEIDRETGEVSILKYVIADDCGVRLNPPVVEGMIQGALAQGVGQTLLEEHVYDESGQYLSSTFMDYLLPTIWEVPMSERTFTETPSPFSPMGVKGAGENAVLATPAALLNAINDALKPLEVRCTTIPATPLRLWNLIQQADQSKTTRKDV
jgi:carbon-monoxide dehydrogenase large subunit